MITQNLAKKQESEALNTEERSFLGRNVAVLFALVRRLVLVVPTSPQTEQASGEWKNYVGLAVLVLESGC